MRENRTVLIGRKTAAMLNGDGRVPPNVIEMRSGAFVDPFDLDPELVFIEDVAGQLARISRFTGCSDSYGAEHAMIVEGILEWNRETALTRLHGLLHDAHEAYLGDVPKPLKRKVEYGFYRSACNRAQDRICDALGIPGLIEEDYVAVRRADALSLLIEARRGLPSRGESWRTTTQELIDTADEYAQLIEPMGMDHASLEAKFLTRYAYLRKDANL